MDKFFRPSPFNGEVKTYPKEYADLIKNPESHQKQLINIIKAKSKSIEEYYPSISQMYDNLILDLKDKYDKIIETNVRFETDPIAGQENLYMDNISLKFEGDYITIKNVNPKYLFRLLEKYFKQINENEYHYLVKLGLSPSSYPLSKLSIISNLIDARKSFKICELSEIITKDIMNEEGELTKCINDVVCSLQKIENHPIEKWNKSDEIGNLITNAANKAICINSLNGSYIVFQNSEQRYTIDIKSQKIITNEGTVDVSSIYTFNIINAAIINGCLTLIGIKDSEVCIIQYKDDKMKKLGEGEYTLVGTGIKLLNSEFCCHIIYNELHLYTNDHKIVIYNLIDKKIIDQSPQFYLFSYENFSCNQIYCVTFDNENTLYVDRRKIETLDNYVTLIRPSYANESYQAISMIADDIMTDITKTFINIIVRGNIENTYVLNPIQHVEYAVSILRKLESSDIPPNLKEFVDIFLARFIVLNLRQIFYKKQNIKENEKEEIIKLFDSMAPTKPVQDIFEIIIKAIKFGIYWPKLVALINERFLKLESTPKFILFKLEQSIFLPFDINDLDSFDDNTYNIGFIQNRIIDLYALVKKSDGIWKYDKEFTHFINFVFSYIKSIYRNEDSAKRNCLEILKELFSILMIIPIGPFLGCTISKYLKEIAQETNMIYEIMLVSDEFKTLMNYFKNYAFNEEIEDIPSISLHTTIFAPKNLKSTIETSFNSPFIKIHVTQKHFEKDKENQVALFNERKLSQQQETTAIDGNKVKIQITGNNENSQYILESVVSQEQDKDGELNVINEDVGKLLLLPYLYLKLSQSIELIFEKSGKEKEHKEVLNLGLLRPNDFHRRLIEYSKAKQFNLNDISSIISKFSIKSLLRNREFNFNIQQLCVKIIISLLWSCGFKDEFESFEQNPTLKTFEEKFKTLFMKQINSIQAKLVDTFGKNKLEFKKIKKAIDVKFDILMNSNCNIDRSKREFFVDKILNFYDFGFTYYEIERIKEVHAFKQQIRNAYEMIFGFITKLADLYAKPLKKGTKNIFIPLARAFVQNIDSFYNKETFEKNEFQNICSEFEDPIINIHLIQLEQSPTRMKLISHDFENDRNFSAFFNSISILYEMSQFIMPINDNPIKPPIQTQYDESHNFIGPGYVALNCGYYWEVAKCVENMREKPSYQICGEIKLKFQSDKHHLIYSTIGAMIGLDAEIFDSEITRYIIDQGKIVEACNYNNTIQRNAESSFKLPPPKFEVTEKLKDTMKDIVHLIDLDTKDYYIAIQNCIILSFMTKVFENYPNKVELVDWSKTLKKLVSQTYQIQGIPNFSNSQFSFLIRQKLKRFTAIDKEVGIPNNDRFIPLTEYTSSNEEAIAGSPSTETFFVYTKQLENYEKIKFKLSKQTNTLKYIGFITDDWDTVFLSLFDMNIYSDKGFTKYTGSQSKVVLSIVDNYLLFGDVKVDSHALKKRWVFMITVCDNSPIRYKISKKLIRTAIKPASVSQMEPHNFDVQAIFPIICLGKQVDLRDHSNMIVSEILDGHRFRIEGTNNSSNAYVQYDVSAFQFNVHYTPFDTLMNNAELSYRIGNRTDILRDLLSTCKSYSQSILKGLYKYYAAKINSEMAIPRIAKLTETSSNSEVNDIKNLIKGFENKVLQEIEEGVRKIENDSSFAQCQDINELSSYKFGYFQIALFQAWDHCIFFNKTFIDGLKLFYKYKKSCLGFIPMILRAFEKEIPSNLSDAKMVLEFFNTPNFDSYFRDMDKMNIRDYFNRLVIFIFEREPDTIVKKQNHSVLINECAKTYISSLWELGQDSSNCERRMPLLLLYSDEGASFNKFVSTGSIYYPIEILLTNGKTKILPKGECPNPYQCKGYRYHFGTNGNQVLEDWRNYKLKDFRELYNLLLVQYILKNKIAESQIGDYPAIVLYFVNIGLSNIKELPDDLFDYQGQDAQKLYDYVKRTISGDNRNCIFLKIEIKSTIARGENINSPNFKTIFGYLMDSGFPQRLYSDEIIYHADYTDEKGFDVGGLFRDSFYFIVEELMNLNLKYFTNKPISLLCESDCLVPSITLSKKQAETIGALISSAIATQNCHRKWKFPLFIWNSFVTDAKLSALVDCNDGDYFNELEKVVTNMRNGFWKVLPLQEVSNLSGRFLKGLACGKEGALDYNSFINLFDERTKSLSIWNTFKQAISNFTSEQFCKLLQFITGIDTPSMKSGYFLKLYEVPTNLKNEEKYLLPFAHTCFLQLDIMPYKSADLLRQKLIVCINNYSTMTG